MPCTVTSLPADKPKIVAYAAMMAIQNFGFFVAYFQIYPSIPKLNWGADEPDDCDDLRFWVGFFALDCFIESFCCIWMAMGGYTDDKCMFTFGWILHLVVALPYCISTVGIPVAMYSEQGEMCREAMGTTGYPLVAAYWTHCGLFMVYVWMMLSITYFSFLKPSFRMEKASAAVQD
ncbi:unnamed protein product [Prorocentrum cordatum]|uniref:EXPERA domain-containing protein n=1 Tax=Prorocentrum cordatum TaxID=2364126 RepID=A0ABN9TIS7_9DINO|nr:unnamed protein product [Polarella glacialis]CAK0845803.1 unnamed protein product [Polarella glacialis]|mmetsp:Transcript_52824/g.137622  ORF Transcript_52824/g.137622 Transcript_52824/m.137622 type:complete len:176 (+) Transcript_52824:89-616(+)